MARYKCTIDNCPRVYEGSMEEIIPQAIAHADGSHRIILFDEDVIEIINQQIQPITTPVPSTATPKIPSTTTTTTTTTLPKETVYTTTLPKETVHMTTLPKEIVPLRAKNKKKLEKWWKKWGKGK